ncbi:hypothetical protein PMIN06_010034 [Paraphaeosphaeria minitans]
MIKKKAARENSAGSCSEHLKVYAEAQCATMTLVILPETYTPDKYTLYSTIISYATTMRSFLGPCSDGWISQKTDWRWIFWLKNGNGTSHPLYPPRPSPSQTVYPQAPSTSPFSTSPFSTSPSAPDSHAHTDPKLRTCLALSLKTSTPKPPAPQPKSSSSLSTF